jgi:hypothetical protein
VLVGLCLLCLGLEVPFTFGPPGRGWALRPQPGRSIALLHPLTSVDRMERLPDGTFMSDISSDHLEGGDPGVGNAEG